MNVTLIIGRSDSGLNDIVLVKHNIFMLTQGSLLVDY